MITRSIKKADFFGLNMKTCTNSMAWKFVQLVDWLVQYPIAYGSKFENIVRTFVQIK